MAREHRARGRDADTAADVPHQVEQAGRVAHALARDRIHRHGRERHEQQRHADSLYQLRPEDVPVARLQVQVRQPQQRAPADHQADGEELSGIEAPGHQTGDRHHHEGADASRRHGDAGLQRRVAEQRLQHHRQQHHAAVEDEPDDRHQKHADGIAPRLEHAQIDDRIVSRQLVHDERYQRDDADDGERRDEGRFEPVFLLSFVEHDLQRADAHDQHPHPPVVHPPRLGAEIRRIEDVELRHHDRRDAHRDVDVEDPAPAVVVRQPPAEHRTENRRDDDAERPEAHGLAAILRRERLQQDRL